MSRILLVVPTHRYKDAYPSFLSASDFPAGLAYIASSLKEAGHEVIGLNLNNIVGYESAYAMVNDRLTKALEEHEPDFVGLGGLCIDYKFLSDAIKIVRQNSKAKIVLGGNIVTHDAYYITELLKPDHAMAGEAEDGFVKIANGQPLDITKPTPIDDLPFPDYDVFNIQEMLDKYSMATRLLYRYPRTNPRPMIIVTARGCPFSCSFCVSHPQGYRARSIENIIKEIKWLYDKYKFNILIVQDELFAVNKKRMKEFCHALIVARQIYDWDFDWMFQTHANARLDLESLQLAKEAGCYFFSYGLESASPTVLKSMKKKTQPSQIAEAINLANQAEVGFGGNILWGDPAETEDTVRETLRFFFEYGSKNHLFFAFVAPYPGSALFDYCVEKGIIKDKLKYYEGIDTGLYHMNQIPKDVWGVWCDFIAQFEKSRILLVKNTQITKYEVEEEDDVIAKYFGRQIWKLWATCPYCGKESVHRQMVGDKAGNRQLLFLVTGCPKCNKHIRINIL